MSSKVSVHAGDVPQQVGGEPLSASLEDYLETILQLETRFAGGPSERDRGSSGGVPAFCDGRAQAVWVRAGWSRTRRTGM